MPFFRIDDKLHFYAHVPKCAGASVEAYLRKRFGSLAFQNSSFYRVPEHARWTRSSPQHVDSKSLELLFPSDWISSVFAVVRHPVMRLRSAYDYQKTGEKSVPEGMDINAWFLTWCESRDARPFQFDNHPRPASELVPKTATCFRMEDGLADVVPHLDTLAGNSDGARKLPHENKSRGGAQYTDAQAPLSQESLARLAEIYAEDFKRFGYVCEDVLKAAPKLSAMPKTSKPFLQRLLGGQTR